jgi:hypothetical protein
MDVAEVNIIFYVDKTTLDYTFVKNNYKISAIHLREMRGMRGKILNITSCLLPPASCFLKTLDAVKRAFADALVLIW